MKKPDGIVFIDANQYIQLYGLSKKRNKVLDLLRVLQDYIFVTSQLVDEVQRNKVEAVVGYFKDSLERLPNWSGIPHHLLHLSGKEVGELNKKLSNYGKARDDVKSEILQAVARTLERISRSEDDISTSLQPIFSRAHRHTAEEIGRARDRRERGNPPGKSRSLGDELTWEQLLRHYKQESRLWIITNDSDYCTGNRVGVFLNAFLHKELLQVNPQINVFCFQTLAEGLEHCAETTGVALQKRIPRQEVEEIKKEQESLPPLGWLLVNEPEAAALYRYRDYLRGHPSYYTDVSPGSVMFSVPGLAHSTVNVQASDPNEDIRKR